MIDESLCRPEKVGRVDIYLSIGSLPASRNKIVVILQTGIGLPMADSTFFVTQSGSIFASFVRNTCQRDARNKEHGCIESFQIESVLQIISEVSEIEVVLL